MQYTKQFMQTTIQSESAEDFDAKMNIIFRNAAGYDKEIDVHYHDNMGFCATVRYWVKSQIPETLSDKYFLLGEQHYCSECQHFKLPTDKRIKYFKCEHNGKRIHSSCEVCDEFYEAIGIDGRFDYEIQPAKLV